MSLSSKLVILSLMGRPAKTPSFQSVINFSGPSPVGCRLRTATLLPSTLHPFIHVLISQLASSANHCPLSVSHYTASDTTQYSPISPWCLSPLYPIPVRGVELTQGGLPAVHGLCGVAMGPGPLSASGQLRLVTSSWRQARLNTSTAHIYYPPPSPPGHGQSWIANYWWNLLILKVLHLKYKLAKKEGSLA